MELNIGLIQEDLADNYQLEIAFLHKYPHGKVIYHLLSSEQLSAYLLGKGSTLDLLILPCRLTADYARQGVLTNFYDTSLMTTWPQAWINVRSQAEIDGKLFGFPKAIYQSFFGWFDTLAQQVGVEKPDRLWTWDAFNKLCQTLPYDLNADGNKDFILMRGDYHSSGLSGWVNDFSEQYAYQYALRGGSFQTPEFEHLIHIFIDICSSGALSKMNDYLPLFNSQDAALISRFSSDSEFMFLGDNCSFMLPPVLDTDNPGYVGQFYTFSLLNNAPHKEAALHFLESALEPTIQNMFVHTGGIFTKTMPEYRITNSSVSLFEAFAPDQEGNMVYTVDNTDGYVIYPVLDEIGEISQENFEDYILMREHLLPNTGYWYELSRLWFELIPQCMNGTLQLPELSLALDDRMAMMQKE
jgi:ABC-type glycerol-3-phosphate transport system substrate-binding protein